MKIEIKILRFSPSFFYWCSMNRWSILRQVGCLLFGVALSYTFIRSQEPAEFVEFDAGLLWSNVNVFDSTRMNIQAHQALLKLHNVEKPELLRGVILDLQASCRKMADFYNALTGNMSSDDLPKFEEFELPLRLSTEDCK